MYLPYWMGQWFGLFATWQGIGLQVLAGTVIREQLFPGRADEAPAAGGAQHNQALSPDTLSTVSDVHP